MAMGMKCIVCYYILASAVSLKFISASSSSPTSCPRSDPILHDIQRQCSLLSPYSPVEMDGESLVKALDSNMGNTYAAVLFSASWCPFSRCFQSKFDALSSMFPQITHFVVDQSSAMPSLFSRYGVHSIPSIFLVNRATSDRYRGPKTFQHLVDFYKRTTGQTPVEHFTEDQFECSGCADGVSLSSSLKVFVSAEPYLALALLFIWFRAILYFSPHISSCLAALWGFVVPRLNPGIFGEVSQHFCRYLHLFDVMNLWTRLKICKTRDFQSAQLWASSIASVPLGRSSSSSSMVS